MPVTPPRGPTILCCFDALSDRYLRVHLESRITGTAPAHCCYCCCANTANTSNTSPRSQRPSPAWHARAPIRRAPGSAAWKRITHYRHHIASSPAVLDSLGNGRGRYRKTVGGRRLLPRPRPARDLDLRMARRRCYDGVQQAWNVNEAMLTVTGRCREHAALDARLIALDALRNKAAAPTPSLGSMRPRTRRTRRRPAIGSAICRYDVHIPPQSRFVVVPRGGGDIQIS